MNVYDEEMLYHAKRVKSLCKTRYSCSGCPMRYTNPLDSDDIKCILMSGIRPEFWILQGDYADEIKSIFDSGNTHAKGGLNNGQSEN